MCKIATCLTTMSKDIVTPMKGKTHMTTKSHWRTAGAAAAMAALGALAVLAVSLMGAIPALAR